MHQLNSEIIRAGLNRGVPQVFDHVLEYLRTLRYSDTELPMPLGRADLELLVREAAFYGLPDLSTKVKAPPPRSTPAAPNAPPGFHARSIDLPLYRSKWCEAQPSQGWLPEIRASFPTAPYLTDILMALQQLPPSLSLTDGAKFEACSCTSVNE